jgi:hypothetical protein
MQRFDAIYIADMDKVSHAVADSLVMRGSSNWDFYFAKKPKNTDFEEINDVVLIEFDDKAELDSFLSANAYINYSLEYEKPCVLVHG